MFFFEDFFLLVYLCEHFLLNALCRVVAAVGDGGEVMSVEEPYDYCCYSL